MDFCLNIVIKIFVFLCTYIYKYYYISIANYLLILFYAYIILVVYVFKIGDFVYRKSYDCDIIFEIIEINDIAILEGVYVRLIADSNLDDLVLAKPEDIRRDDALDKQYEKRVIDGIRKKKNFIVGRILHIDGDEKYLNKCLNLYKSVNCYAVGVYLNEKNLKDEIISLINQYMPDIIVITGHDSFNKKDIRDLNNYLNTKHFMDCIREIRKYHSKDSIFIMAGACQSNFEALIASGANFATSPKRVNIHAYDPAIVAIIAAYTPFNRIINIEDIIYHSSSEREGIGGVESYGKLRLLL